jgi:periplasmic copper chaperone A
MSRYRRLGRIGAIVAGLAIAGMWAADAAWAHVTVTAPGVVAGDSDATIVFRVPTESDTASTIGLKLQLPTDTPIAGVLVAPQQGWTATITQSKLAKPIQTDDGAITEIVSEIDWKAGAGAGIKPGFFGEFTIIGGKLPDGVTTLTFKAIQSYSDGKQVAWIEQRAPGSTAEPDHPAPVLHLPAASGSAASGSASSPATGSTPTVSAAPAATSNKGASKAAATTGIVLGGIGVALGAAALVLTLRRRRPAGHDAT